MKEAKDSQAQNKENNTFEIKKIQNLSSYKTSSTYIPTWSTNL
jgi:hypothetical protein